MSSTEPEDSNALAGNAPLATPAPLAVPAPLATPLAALHERLGAKSVEFTGYLLPLRYPQGIAAEHLHCRTSAALFDVSHMGRTLIEGEDAGQVLSRLLPLKPEALAPGRMRYSFLLNAQGGIIDDMILAALPEGGFLAVFNASRKERDRAELATLAVDRRVSIRHFDEHEALIALQGPKAVSALAAIVPGVESLSFMGLSQEKVALGGGGERFEVRVARCGYTGEDGFEIAVPEAQAEAFAEALLAREGVAAAGLGARDSLRIEAGLPLYGQEMDEDVSPVDAGLLWALPKSLRTASAPYTGAAALAARIALGAQHATLGLVAEDGPQARLPARRGAALRTQDGSPCGVITSGGFAPSLGKAASLARVALEAAGETRFTAEVRGKQIPLRAVPLPFVPHNYKR